MKMAFDPEDFTWCVSSEAVYAEFAGDEIPERLCTAHESGRLSTCDIFTLDAETPSVPLETHCVVSKDGNNFAPLRSLIWKPIQVRS